MSIVFIEQRILRAIRGLLTGRVNEILRDMEFIIPIIEFGGYGCGYAAVPVIALTACERSEKERIVRMDAYSLSITFTVPEIPESELYCYTYANAVCKAVSEDTTLGGVVERALITGKKYCLPKNPYFGENWEVIITLRITIEEMENKN